MIKDALRCYRLLAVRRLRSRTLPAMKHVVRRPSHTSPSQAIDETIAYTRMLRPRSSLSAARLKPSPAATLPSTSIGKPTLLQIQGLLTPQQSLRKHGFYIYNDFSTRNPHLWQQIQHLITVSTKLERNGRIDNKRAPNSGNDFSIWMCSRLGGRNAKIREMVSAELMKVAQEDLGFPDRYILGELKVIGANAGDGPQSIHQDSTTRCGDVVLGITLKETTTTQISPLPYKSYTTSKERHKFEDRLREEKVNAGVLWMFYKYLFHRGPLNNTDETRFILFVTLLEGKKVDVSENGASDDGGSGSGEISEEEEAAELREATSSIEIDLEIFNRRGEDQYVVQPNKLGRPPKASKYSGIVKAHRRM